MLIDSSEQLRALTGNYYANNDFTKIQGDIEQATEDLAALVGEGVIAQAEQAEEGDTLRLKVQRPIAILATLRLYQKNDLSHEDDGRKFKVSTDGADKLPWEWQLDRDDACSTGVRKYSKKNTCPTPTTGCASAASVSSAS